jgi:hypothetical protein
MKIRTGFVSNSSSSAFILTCDGLSICDLKNLAMAFDFIQVMDSGEIIITYSIEEEKAIDILDSLLPNLNFRLNLFAT